MTGKSVCRDNNFKLKDPRYITLLKHILVKVFGEARRAGRRANSTQKWRKSDKISGFSMAMVVSSYVRYERKCLTYKTGIYSFGHILGITFSRKLEVQSKPRTDKKNQNAIWLPV